MPMLPESVPAARPEEPATVPAARPEQPARAPASLSEQAAPEHYTRAEKVALHTVHLLGLAGLIAGLAFLRQTDIGADPLAALRGIASQLATTAPAALLVAFASGLNLAAGAVVLRLLAGTPFSSISSAALAGLVGAVLVDIGLLATLASVGLFQWPLLLAANAGIVGLGGAVVLRTGPLLRPGWRARGWPGLWPFAWLIVLLVWAGPLLVQLASPVVPFLDVLPNHVAPVEHLRAFGGLSSLDSTASPIYGPSRIFLGYQALLGVIVESVELPAMTAVGAFALPLLLLVAAAGRGLARAVGGPRAGQWALLIVPLSVTFLRIADARAGVVALPIAAISLWLLLEPLGADGRRRSLVMLATLAAAYFVHPLIGLLAAASVGLLALFRPTSHAWALPAVFAAPVLALPQWAAMLGLDLPPWTALLGLPLAVGVLWGMGRAGALVPAAAVRALEAGIPMVTAAGLLIALVVTAFLVPAAPERMVQGIGGMVEWYAVLLAGALLAFGLARHRPGWAMPLAPVAVAAAAGAAVSLVPTGSQLADALRFEVPKTLTYFGPTFLAVAAAVGLAALWERRSWPLAARAICCGLILLAAAAPIRSGVVHPLSLGEHRLSESLSVSLRNAEHGYWVGFPDSRRLVDEPRAGLIEALRAEIAAGRLTGDSGVLHVARSFQPWVSAPLAVFAGVVETMASLDPEDSIHTAGGRLEDVADLPLLLAGPFGYVVLEPAGLDPGTAGMIERAGFRPIFGNMQGTVFVLDQP